MGAGRVCLRGESSGCAPAFLARTGLVLARAQYRVRAGVGADPYAFGLEQSADGPLDRFGVLVPAGLGSGRPAVPRPPGYAPAGGLGNRAKRLGAVAPALFVILYFVILFTQ